MNGVCGYRCIFDIDGIDLGPERRAYLEHHLDRVWEVNSQGSIPYVPYLRAPYYVWIGRKPAGGHAGHEAKAEAPALFPPTFLYSQSWEDPLPDMKVFGINDKDVCLTLTSGGCNSLNLVRRLPLPVRMFHRLHSVEHTSTDAVIAGSQALMAMPHAP